MNIADELFYNGKKYVKLAIASERLGVSRELLDKQCRQKKLEAERVYDQWFVLESALSRLLPVASRFHPNLLQSSVVTISKMSGALTGLIGVLAYLTLVSVMPSGLLQRDSIINSQLMANGNEALEQSAATLEQAAGSLTWGSDQVFFTAAIATNYLELSLLEIVASVSDQTLLLASQGSLWFETQTTQVPFNLFLAKEQLMTAVVAGANLGSTTVIERVASTSDWALNLTGRVIDFTANLWSQIKINWARFFGGKAESVPTTTAPDTGLSQIQSDIKEIKTGISEILRRLPAAGSAPTQSVLPTQGVVVVPSGSTTPEALKNRVAEMFSDQVKVNVDPSGKAGVVTPIFRDRTGEDYIFVLTPIKQ